jgi:hypothetical protein
MSHITYLVMTLVVLGMAGNAGAFVVTVSSGNDDNTNFMIMGNAGMDETGIIDTHMSIDMSGDETNMNVHHLLNSKNYACSGTYQIINGHPYASTDYRTIYGYGHITNMDGVFTDHFTPIR